MNNAWVRGIPVNPWLLALAGIGALLAMIDIIDFVEIPFESSFSSISFSTAFGGLATLMFTFGYLGLFVLMFLENVSLPVPSEVVLPLAGYLIFMGKMTFPLAVGVATFAGITGGLAAYGIALVLGRPLVYGFAKRVGVDEQMLLKSERWLSGKGSIIILVARFVPGIRSSISLPAGALKMNLWRFSVMTLIGSFGWSALLIYAGYSAGRYWQAGASAISNSIMQALPYAVLVLSAFYTAYFIQRKISLARRLNA
ncbi:MAG: DedA family protein [Nitrososphaerales archaeon]